MNNSNNSKPGIPTHRFDTNGTTEKPVPKILDSTTKLSAKERIERFKRLRLERITKSNNALEEKLKLLGGKSNIVSNVEKINDKGNRNGDKCNDNDDNKINKINKINNKKYDNGNKNEIGDISKINSAKTVSFNENNNGTNISTFNRISSISTNRISNIHSNRISTNSINRTSVIKTITSNNSIARENRFQLKRGQVNNIGNSSTSSGTNSRNNSSIKVGLNNKSNSITSIINNITNDKTSTINSVAINKNTLSNSTIKLDTCSQQLDSILKLAKQMDIKICDKKENQEKIMVDDSLKQINDLEVQVYKLKLQLQREQKRIRNHDYFSIEAKDKLKNQIFQIVSNLDLLLQNQSKLVELFFNNCNESIITGNHLENDNNNYLMLNFKYHKILINLLKLICNSNLTTEKETIEDLLNKNNKNTQLLTPAALFVITHHVKSIISNL
ncbi:hypothetical protein K502DRAFT_343276 [Neoconidiobolus thromboides FSU 785]|nr:hypothetical protein K502DRAFT_343276 [Neoconidiobolus thromboides FSU 785]